MPEKIIINRLPDVLPDGVQPWPSTLPDPLYSGYQFSDPDGRIITDMDQGPPKIRQGYVSNARRYKLEFLFSRDQLTAFINFYKNDLSHGVLPVSMVVSDERGFAYSYVNILNELRYVPVTRRGHFSVTVEAIEVGRP